MLIQSMQIIKPNEQSNPLNLVMHHFTETDENEIAVRVKRMIEKIYTVHKITEDVKYTDH